MAKQPKLPLDHPKGSYSAAQLRAMARRAGRAQAKAELRRLTRTTLAQSDLIDDVRAAGGDPGHGGTVKA